MKSMERRLTILERAAHQLSPEIQERDKRVYERFNALVGTMDPRDARIVLDEVGLYSEFWREELAHRRSGQRAVSTGWPPVLGRLARLALEKLQRLGKAYVDGVYKDEDYKRERRHLELDLESLVVPQVSAAEEAGKLLKELPNLWAGATMGERRKILLAMLDAVYIDTKESKQVVVIQPKPAFRPVFEVATTKAGSGLTLVKEPPASAQEAQLCSWWRRRRVEPYREHGEERWAVVWGSNSPLDQHFKTLASGREPSPVLSGGKWLVPSDRG